MAWVILITSGALEAVWATALARSDGLKRPRATAVFVVALVVSMVGLGWAMQFIPTGTAYAVWVGIGAVGTALVGMLVLGESASVARLVCLLLVVSGIVGLKIFH